MEEGVQDVGQISQRQDGLVDGGCSTVPQALCRAGGGSPGTSSVSGSVADDLYKSVGTK